LFASKFPDIQTKIIELDVIDGGSNIQKTLGTMTGQRTVPNVFVNGKHLGGDDDTQASFRSGNLKKMLE